jgi:regulator of G-protein signaling
MIEFQPLDLGDDISTLGSKEVMIEKRVLFRMDLPHRKSIGVKAKPNRTVRDVFKPILNKYGYKLDSIIVQMVGKRIESNQREIKVANLSLQL